MSEKEQNKTLIKEVLTELGLDPYDEHELFERMYLRAKFYYKELDKQDLKNNLTEWCKAELKSQHARLLWSLQYSAVSASNGVFFETSEQ